MFAGLASFVQLLLNAVVTVLNAICILFPDSPFQWVQGTGFGNLIAKINYFLPVYEFLAMAEAWLVAVALYYAIAVIARWVKAIE